MRWWLLILGLLVLGSSVAGWVHPRGVVAGEELVGALERKGGELRGGVLVLEEEVDDGGMAGVRGVTLKTGAGDLPGEQLMGRADRRWAMAEVKGGEMGVEAVRFSWQGRPSVVERLRGMVAAGESGIGEAGGAEGAGSLVYQRIVKGVEEIRPGMMNVEEMMRGVEADLGRQTDLELMEEWVRADRGVMMEKDDLMGAAREGLMLLAREERGPVMRFRVGGGVVVYGVPLEGVRGRVMMELNGYDDGGRILFSGVMEVDGVGGGMPEPRGVRLWGVRMGEVGVKKDEG